MTMHYRQAAQCPLLPPTMRGCRSPILPPYANFHATVSGRGRQPACQSVNVSEPSRPTVWTDESMFSDFVAAAPRTPDAYKRWRLLGIPASWLIGLDSRQLLLPSCVLDPSRSPTQTHAALAT
jgi:hypothetical protein